MNENELINENAEDTAPENTPGADIAEPEETAFNNNGSDFISTEEIIKRIENVTKYAEEQKDRYLRIAAEYDNYRKRTAKEREGIYAEAYGDALKEILPILDSFELAVKFGDGKTGVQTVSDGMKLILAQCAESLKRLGVDVIDQAGNGVKFDPVYHNAVMHVEDENYGENEVTEVLQKGYVKGDKVIRHAMVKVAN
jgi:molecular chaperone GrpE